MYCHGHINGGYQIALGKIQKITCKGQSNLLAQVETVQVSNMKAQVIEYHQNERRGRLLEFNST